MNEYSDDSRDKLYHDFKKSVINSPADTFYDESDLIEIFDYAGDRGDDATRTEVLALAARLYPESEPLKIRKALYYYYMNQEDIARDILNGNHSDGILWDILKLRLDNPDDDKLPQLLQDITDRYSKIDDEGMIQLVDLANTHNQLQWVVDHIDYLKTKTSYTPTLLYEVAVMASLADDNATVIRMIDELTSLEPFYAPYWMMLAKAHAESGNNSEALNALDYALAIEPEMEDAILMKAQIMILEEMDMDSILPTLHKLAQQRPTNMNAVRTLALALRAMHRDEEAVDVYLIHLSDNPGNRELLEEYLDYPGDIKFLVEKYYDSSGETSEAEYMSIAHKLSNEGNHRNAWQVLEVYHEREGLTVGFTMYVTELYMDKAYKRLEAMLDPAKENLFNAFFSPMVSLIYTLTMLRNLRSRKVTNFISQWIERNKQAWFPSPADRVLNTGVSYYLNTLYEWVYDSNGESLDHIDPLKPLSSSPPELF